MKKKIKRESGEKGKKREEAGNSRGENMKEIAIAGAALLARWR